MCETLYLFLLEVSKTISSGVPPILIPHSDYALDKIGFKVCLKKLLLFILQFWMTSPIWLNRLITWVRMRASSRFQQWLWAILATDKIISCLNISGIRIVLTVSEAINYILNLLMLSTTTLTAARQRQTALFILSFQGVVQWEEESLFLLLCFSINFCFL